FFASPAASGRFFGQRHQPQFSTLQHHKPTSGPAFEYPTPTPPSCPKGVSTATPVRHEFELVAASSQIELAARKLFASQSQSQSQPIRVQPPTFSQFSGFDAGSASASLPNSILPAPLRQQSQFSSSNQHQQNDLAIAGSSASSSSSTKDDARKKHFEPTDQQKQLRDFVPPNPGDNIRAEALAGCGKTTTASLIVDAWRKRVPGVRLGYFVFNKQAEQDAKNSGKFPKQSVQIWTTHAFAMFRLLGLAEGKQRPIGDPKRFQVEALLGNTMASACMERVTHSGFVKSAERPTRDSYVFETEEEKLDLLRDKKRMEKITASMTQFVIKTFRKFLQSNSARVRDKHAFGAMVKLKDIRSKKSRWKKAFQEDSTFLVRRAQQLWNFYAHKIAFLMPQHCKDRYPNPLPFLPQKDPAHEAKQQTNVGNLSGAADLDDPDFFKDMNFGKNAETNPPVPFDAFLKAYQFLQEDLGTGFDRYCVEHPQTRMIPSGRPGTNKTNDPRCVTCPDEKGCNRQQWDGFHALLVDECQDLTPCQSDIFYGPRQQNVCSYLLGDKHQRIYAWRGAGTDFERAPVVKEFPLSNSWRFGPKIGAAAQLLLNHASGGPGRAATIRGAAEVSDESVELATVDDLAAHIRGGGKAVISCRSNKGMLDDLMALRAVLQDVPRFCMIK
ncbi:unnamed protein product, partial [Amoebophrya sp. A120]